MLTIGRLERARDWCMFKQSALSAMPLTRYDATAIVCTGILLGIDAIHICDIWCCNRIPKCCHFTHHQHQQQPWWCLVLGAWCAWTCWPAAHTIASRWQITMNGLTRSLLRRKEENIKTNKQKSKSCTCFREHHLFIYLFIYIYPSLDGDEKSVVRLTLLLGQFVVR